GILGHYFHSAIAAGHTVRNGNHLSVQRKSSHYRSKVDDYAELSWRLFRRTFLLLDHRNDDVHSYYWQWVPLHDGRTYCMKRPGHLGYYSHKGFHRRKSYYDRSA